MTYEGGAAINGPFLGMLGASAAAISIIAGVGEFLGYTLRSVAGYVADKTGRYWLVTFIGYAVNLLAVPAMALAASWQLAGALILAERIHARVAPRRLLAHQDRARVVRNHRSQKLLIRDRVP